MGNLFKANFIVGFLSGGVVGVSIMVLFFGTPQADMSDQVSVKSAESAVLANQATADKSSSNLVLQRNGGLLSSKEDLAPQINSSTQAASTTMVKRSTTDCDEVCIETLANKFIEEADLTSADWDSIKDNNDSLAAMISANPDAVNSLRDKISFASDQSEIDGLMTIVSAFPDDMALKVITDVSNYSNTHKALALQTLGGMSVYSQGAAREIENMVIGARDPQVISAALTALETTDNYDFNPETWQSLSNQIPYVEDAQLKGSILVSLAKHEKADITMLKNNIEEGLSSDYSELQGASIEALRYLVSRSEDHELLTSTDGSSDMLTKLNAIANNAAADSSLRIDALRLLNEAF